MYVSICLCVRLRSRRLHADALIPFLSTSHKLFDVTLFNIPGQPPAYTLRIGQGQVIAPTQLYNILLIFFAFISLSADLLLNLKSSQ